MEENKINIPPVEPSINPPQKSQGFKKFVLVVLGILLVITTVLALVGCDIYTVLFNPLAIQRRLGRELQQSDILPAALAEMSHQRAMQRMEAGEMLSGAEEPDILLLLSFVELEEWKQIQALVLPDELVLQMLSTALAGVYDWMESDATSAQVSLDMQPIKTLLAGTQGEKVIMVAYATLPQCTQADLDDFETRRSQASTGDAVLYNLCQFPDPYHDDQVADYIASLKDVQGAIPDHIKVGEDSQPIKAEDVNQLRAIKLVLRSLRFLGHWGWVIPLLLAGIIIAIGVRSFRSLGNRVGIPLLIAGLFTLPMAILGRLRLIDLALSKLPGGIPTLMIDSLDTLIPRLIGFAFLPLLVGSSIILGLGVILVILGLAIRHREKST